MKLLPFSSWRELLFICTHPGLLMRKGLYHENMNPDPVQEFQAWMTDAQKNLLMEFPNAFCLSTFRSDGYPDGRMVLMKELNEDGLVFYTNTTSSKGISLEKHPKASATFYWGPIQRQVRIRGDISKVTDEQADKYFSSRPRVSQIGAWASSQSQVLQTRAELEEKAREYEETFAGKEIPRPPRWTGFALKPVEFEFWQLRVGRMHDRFLYKKIQGDNWSVVRLSP